MLQKQTACFVTMWMLVDMKQPGFAAEYLKFESNFV